MFMRGGAHTIRGEMILIGFREHMAGDSVGDECYGFGGYDDMQGGTDVTVRDGDGSLVGTSRLQEGEIAEVDGDFQVCSFKFLVKVEDAAFYEVEVSHRGGLTYTKDELETEDWEVFASLDAVNN